MIKINKGVVKVVQKVASKKLGNFEDQLGDFEELFKQGSQDEMDFMMVMINFYFPKAQYNLNLL